MLRVQHNKAMANRTAETAVDDAIRAFVITAEGTTNFSVRMNLEELGSGMADR